jgi:cell division transport system permease protein
MFLAITRSIKESGINFVRNGYLSVAAVSVMLLSLFSISALFFLMLIGNGAIRNIENNIDISVYFKPDISEDSIFNDKADLEKFSEIKTVKYVSKDQALESFKSNNADNSTIMNALNEIGENPLPASLIIEANNVSRYNLINDYLKNATFKDDISYINYSKNKEVIDRLNYLVAETKKIGLTVSGVLSFITILIVFNTIRITIYTHRKEVEIMRLVGASNVYIRLPFIFEGIIYGFGASLISLVFLFISIRIVTPYLVKIIAGIDFMQLYLTNFWFLFGMQVLIGSILGIISSLIAIRKYLKI